MGNAPRLKPTVNALTRQEKEVFAMETLPSRSQAVNSARYFQICSQFKRERSDHSFRYHLNNFTRASRSWMVPYAKTRIHAKEFHPVLCFLYTDLNCNLDCHYCYSKGRKIPGMTLQTAMDAVDWLRSKGCKVLAYMGGEPLVRKSFILEITRYAVERGMFVYLPTNGTLLDEKFIDAIGEAGVATVNLAVDAMDGYTGIPKNLNRIRGPLEYLVRREKRYGYITFFNINITRNNIDDVRQLTQIAHDYGIATDYHINEQPPIDYSAFDPEKDCGWITGRDIERVDGVIDWLIEKNRSGYTMVNSVEHLAAMKLFIRNRLPAWPCRAGELSMIMRLDGSFAPCFELYGDSEDWGSIYAGAKFDVEKLAERKQGCSPHCLSTCNFQVTHYTRSLRHTLQWVAKHAYARFFGVS